MCISSESTAIKNRSSARSKIKWQELRTANSFNDDNKIFIYDLLQSKIIIF